MEAFVDPVLFYLCLAVGGVGVCLALPRPKVSPQLIGAILAAIGFGLIFLLLGLRTYQGDPGDLPNPYFYIFSLIAVGASLRVVSHPRPVYAALYFILTILSSSVLYLLLEAEFMAFALIIIYAGAILITYLFVIMLATQAPTETEIGALSEYDAYSREPMLATIAGFVLLAVLSGLIATGLKGGEAGTAELRPAATTRADLTPLLPRKVVREFDSRGFFSRVDYDGGSGTPFVKPELDEIVIVDNMVTLQVDDVAAARVAMDPERRSRIAELAAAGADEDLSDGEAIFVTPRRARASNIDGVGWALVASHPMALELAGVILLMAMLGAVVLARKQIELTEDEKAARARTLASEIEGGSS